MKSRSLKVVPNDKTNENSGKETTEEAAIITVVKKN
jgi:hypothetical protein